MKTAEELQAELDQLKKTNEENVKALQQKLSDRDNESKKLLAQLEELKKKGESTPEAEKKIEDLKKEIEGLSKNIEDINVDKRKEALRTKYPDIVTDLLVGKSDEEIEIIVTNQRKLIAENYDTKPSNHGPVYKDRTAIETELKAIREDKSLSTEEKLIRTSEVKNAQAET